MANWHVAVMGVCLAALTAWPAAAQSDDALSIGVGAFSIEEPERSAEFRFEYHPGLRVLEDSLWDGFDGFGPVIGLMVNSDGGVFGYGGVQTDVVLAERWIANGAAGIGGYASGDGPDLGGVFQFHLSGTLAYEVANGHRLGLTWAHISNASIHEANPAANSVLITYRARLDTLF